MSITPTWPGVYIQELPSGNKTITPVATSITAFVGTAPRGQTDQIGPVLIGSWGDYQQQFGGLSKSSNMSYAVNQFFENGGSQAVIVRVSKGTATTFSVPGATWLLQAANPGAWGNGLTITIDTLVDQTLWKSDNYIFNLTIVDHRPDGSIFTEKFVNVSLSQTSPNFVASVLQDQSQLLVVAGYPQQNNIPQPPTAALLSHNTPPPSSPNVTVATSGVDGSPPAATDIIGNAPPEPPTGIYALQKADLFNILCIPPYDVGVDASPPPSGSPPGSATQGVLYSTVYPAALGYFTNFNKRAILLVDPPSDWHLLSTITSPTAGFTTLITKDKNAAIYYPRIQAPDLLANSMAREFVPCGAVAGVIAQTDAQRGVWKAPAGLEANLSGVVDLSDGGFQVRLSDFENGVLNPLGINCLRIMPNAGFVVWGARTMRGADMLADQWKYLPIRRTAQFIEESLYRGTQWVVFEPNDEPLWKSIRLSVGAFMQELFLKGAFQGSTPSQAYLVKCDSETNPQYLIDQGIVTILVGFAPLYPAEFVILQIQQLTAQAGS